MTIAVIWKEAGHLWCAADSRLVAGEQDQTVTESVAKIFSIPIIVHAQDYEGFLRAPHYWTQYGFVYAGSTAAASMTAITATTLLQQLARQGDRTSPPRFEEIAGFVRNLAERFMKERRQFGGDGTFWSAFFGWCPHAETWKVAHIYPHGDAGNFRVELQYPPAPERDGAAWLVLGSGQQTFEGTRADLLSEGKLPSKHEPRLVIEKMISEQRDRTVGGTISIGAAHKSGFSLFHSEVPDPWDTTGRLRVFNGIDLDREVGEVFPYHVATQKMP